MRNGKRRIVFKVGTSTLAHHTGRTNIRHMEELVKVLSDIHNSGVQVVLVSSGAIGMGAAKLGLQAKPVDTPSRQAAASVGQCELMFLYDKMFSDYGQIVAQMLITKADLENDTRRSNFTNAFEKLFQYNAIPIINENDSVAIEEIVFGDNDTLSAEVAKCIGADELVILSDIDGLYTKNPKNCDDACLISIVEDIDESIISIAGGTCGNLGTGGMATKVKAAQIAGEAGIDTIVMNSTPITNLYRYMDGENIGTRFKAHSQKKREG
ncbi:MAG TPA: glutamate 5-kinase [Clostridiales bacterium]|jgi:glutamate 5-kinase|nr:glutamate 5-kinase [Clostridiales bacterium]